jgi:hypothetical protein
MRDVFVTLLIVALAASRLPASYIWLSSSDEASPLGEVPLVESTTGATDQRLYIWARPDAESTLLHWSLNLRSSEDGVIELKNVQVHNPDLVPPGTQLRDIRRHEFLLDGKEVVINRNLIAGMGAYSIANEAWIGAGLGSSTAGADPLYNSQHDAFLLASVTYDVIGPGTAEFYLQIGASGIVNLGGESEDQNVVFGDPSDPALNAGGSGRRHSGGGRGIDSATADARIVAYGDPLNIWQQTMKIDAVSPERPIRGFGQSVAAYGAQLAVGANGEDRSGPVHVYQRTDDGWAEVAMLIAKDENRGVLPDFGDAIAMWGDHIIVGAPGHDEGGTNSGAAYFFEKVGSNWTETLRFKPPEGSLGDNFGAAVAAQGDWGVVGAPNHGQDELHAGAAYVFERVDSGWNQVAKLEPGDGIDNAKFGASVAMSENRIVVGAKWHDSQGERSGAAYVFEKVGSAWSEVAKLVPADGEAGDAFGGSVAILGDRIVVTAMGDDDQGENTGAAFVFEKQGSTWIEVTKLVAAERSKWDFFGGSVGITEERIFVGSSGDVGGAVVVFENHGSTWQEVATLKSTDRQRGDGLGSAMAVWGETVFVGGPGADIDWNTYEFSDEGALYVFEAPADFSAKLVSASPVSIAQSVDIPTESVELTVDYRFLTPSGTLAVLLDDVLIGTVSATVDKPGEISTANFAVDGTLLGRSDVELKLVLDSPTGSALLIDEIGFPALINAGFRTGNLFGWSTAVSPGGSITTVRTAAVPEPSAWLLALAAVVGSCGWLRSPRPRAASRHRRWGSERTGT